ncbi:MAG: hypothetical protein HYY17_11720 [Planctomycetes bacterium]|nr:hypothetical protein [Planctomycetota bacterium]
MRGRIVVSMVPPGYRTQSPDTSFEAEQILFEGYRRMTPAERIHRACELEEMGRRISLAALRKRYPGESDRDLALRLASFAICPADLRAAFGWEWKDAPDAAAPEGHCGSRP